MRATMHDFIRAGRSSSQQLPHAPVARGKLAGAAAASAQQTLCNQLQRHPPTASTASSTCTTACAALTARRCRRGRGGLAAKASAVPAPAPAPAPTPAVAPTAGVASPAQPYFPPVVSSAFAPSGTSFMEQHRIRGGEVGTDQRAGIVTVAGLLQEVAGNHAVGMWGRAEQGFAGLPELKDLVFVMTRLQIHMEGYPRWGDVVGLETYFHEEGRLSARREWLLTDVASGRLLGSATSTWVTINYNTRRLAKLPDNLRTKLLAFSPPTNRNALDPATTKQKLPDLPEPPPIMGPRQQARRSDMDMNGHVNNVTYVSWLLDTLPNEVHDAYTLSDLEIDFKGECQAGNYVELCAAPAQAAANTSDQRTQFLHVLRKCDESGCSELVRARTTWVPRATKS